MKLFYLKNKIYYALYSPIAVAYMKLKAIKFQIPSFFNGFPYFHKAKGSVLIIGKDCRFSSRTTANLIGINHRCMISTLTKEANLVIGDGCGFSGTTIGCFKSIILGNNIRCGANTLITDSDWHNDDPRVGPPRAVIIHDNVWLGYNAVVLKGVTIGENSIIGACSVVVSDIPPNVIAAGNPCRVLKNI